MIIYLDIIILYWIEKAILQTPILLINQYISLSAFGCKSDSDWLRPINHNSNAVATVKQMYSFSHNAICFKYTYEKDKQCQFDFSYSFIDASFVGQHGVIKLKKNYF